MRRNKYTHLAVFWLAFIIHFNLVPSAFAQSEEPLQYPTELESKSLKSIQIQSQALNMKTEIEAQKVSIRWKHAKELLGKYYQKSIVKSGEEVALMDDVLLHWTEQELKGKWKKFSPKISNAIIHESEKYGFDPVFLMAVISNESDFNPTVRGTSGELGLMQISPKTAQWITKKYSLPWKGARSLKDPVTNIQIGAAYMAYLRTKFEFKSQLYLAAYNMGASNVFKSLEKQIWPKEYSSRVIKHYKRFYAALDEEIKRKLN